MKHTELFITRIRKLKVGKLQQIIKAFQQYNLLGYPISEQQTISASLLYLACHFERDTLWKTC